MVMNVHWQKMATKLVCKILCYLLLDCVSRYAGRNSELSILIIIMKVLLNQWCFKLLILYIILTETQLMLSPSGVARVCPGGDLAITCSIDRSFLEWNITPSFTIPGQPYRTRLVSVSSPDLVLLVLNMISFDFSHSTHSNESSTTLVSVLSVTSVPDILNGTRVSCTDIGTSLTETSTSTVTVHVFRSADMGE